MNKLLKMHHWNFFLHFLILGKVVLFNLSSLKLKFYRPPPQIFFFLNNPFKTYFQSRSKEIHA